MKRLDTDGIKLLLSELAWPFVLHAHDCGGWWDVLLDREPSTEQRERLAAAGYSSHATVEYNRWVIEKPRHPAYDGRAERDYEHG